MESLSSYFPLSRGAVLSDAAASRLSMTAHRFHVYMPLFAFAPRAITARSGLSRHEGARFHLRQTLTRHARVFRGSVLPRQSREAANATLLCMLKANRKAFQPLMQSLMGAWWCSQADTATEVSVSTPRRHHRKLRYFLTICFFSCGIAFLVGNRLEHFRPLQLVYLLNCKCS